MRWLQKLLRRRLVKADRAARPEMIDVVNVRSRRLRASGTSSAAPLLAASATLFVAATTGAAHGTARVATPTAPLRATIFSPGASDVAGVGGKGFVVDLALDATAGHNADLVGHPRFIAPTDPAFKPGPNPAVPGLVVTLSTNKKHTNLANLFQLTGVATVSGNKEIWTTWLAGKALFGVNVESTLTVYVVKGMAPTVVTTPPAPDMLLSNVATSTFHLSGAPMAPMQDGQHGSQATTSAVPIRN